LHPASKFGAPEVARLLLEHGADIKVKNDDGRTALQIAVKDEFKKLLLEHEAR
jgi:ankyrin repeat protein